MTIARPRTAPTVVEHWDGPVLTGHVEAVVSCAACIANGLTGCATPVTLPPCQDVSLAGRPRTPGPGANRPCADCGTNVTHTMAGYWQAPFHVPCPVSGVPSHRVDA